MYRNEDFARWVARLERSDSGYTFVRLYADAPGWVRLEAISRFGKGTVFIPFQHNKPVSINPPVEADPVGAHRGAVQD